MVKGRQCAYTKTMSFKDYIARRRVTDTPAGDFTSEAKKDGRLPDAKTWRELKGYVINRRGAHSVVQAAYQVWAGYRASLGRAKFAKGRTAGNDLLK